ncbi:hypothetical protein BDZ97DRAFT_1785116, partial [Flammula alnicola]
PTTLFKLPSEHYMYSPDLFAPLTLATVHRPPSLHHWPSMYVFFVRCYDIHTSS